MAGRKKGTVRTHEELAGEIRKKAYEIYELSGRKPGRDLDNWLEAEKMVTRKADT